MENLLHKEVKKALYFSLMDHEPHVVVVPSCEPFRRPAFETHQVDSFESSVALVEQRMAAMAEKYPTEPRHAVIIRAGLVLKNFNVDDDQSYTTSEGTQPYEAQYVRQHIRYELTEKGQQLAEAMRRAESEKRAGADSVEESSARV